MQSSFLARLRRNRRNFLLLAGAILALEILLRIAMPEPVHTYFYGLAGELWDEDPDLFWVPVHGYKTELAKFQAVDSDHLIFSFGGSILTNHTANTNFPAELEKMLAPKYAVANFATGGYSSHQSLVLSRKMVERKAPHLVIVCHGYNDRGASLASDLEMSERNRLASVRLLHFLSGSKIVQGMRRLAWTAMGYNPYKLNPGAKNIRLRVPPADFEANLRAFVAEARERKIKLVFMTQAVVDAAVRRDLEPYFNIMRDTAAWSRYAYFLDVRPAFEKYYVEKLGYMPGHPTLDKSVMLLHNDACHLSDDGHRLAAGLLFDFLGANGLTP